MLVFILLMENNLKYLQDIGVTEELYDSLENIENWESEILTKIKTSNIDSTTKSDAVAKLTLLTQRIKRDFYEFI